MSTIDELRKLIEAGVVKVEEIEEAKAAFEAIDLLAPGGPIVVQGQSEEVQEGSNESL